MSRHKETRIPTLEQSVARMKREVEDYIRRGVIPANAGSFGELHDYIDANCLGGFCDEELADAMIAHYGGRDADEGMPDGMLDHIGKAQDAVDEWLRETQPQVA